MLTISGPTPGSHRAEPGSDPLHVPAQIDGCEWDPPEPLLLQLKRTRFQPLLPSELPQALQHLGGPELGSQKWSQHPKCCLTHAELYVKGAQGQLAMRK